jgi:hypothetical protein
LGRDRTNQIARFSPGGAFGWLICRQESCVVPLRSPLQARERRSHKGKMRWNGRKHFLRLEAGRYRRTPRPIIGGRQLRARRVAEGATTEAEKARLLDDADHYDELAANADRTGAEAEKS